MDDSRCCGRRSASGCKRSWTKWKPNFGGVCTNPSPNWVSGCKRWSVDISATTGCPGINMRCGAFGSKSGGSGTVHCRGAAGTVASFGIACGALSIAGCRCLLSVILIPCVAWASLPKARAGCGSSARPDPWRGLCSITIPTPTARFDASSFLSGAWFWMLDLVILKQEIYGLAPKRQTRYWQMRFDDFRFACHPPGIWAKIARVCTSGWIWALGRNPVANVLHWRIPKQPAVLPTELWSALIAHTTAYGWLLACAVRCRTTLLSSSREIMPSVRCNFVCQFRSRAHRSRALKTERSLLGPTTMTKTLLAAFVAVPQVSFGSANSRRFLDHIEVASVRAGCRVLDVFGDCNRERLQAG